jgi:hypothetical protein
MLARPICLLKLVTSEQGDSFSDSSFFQNLERTAEEHLTSLDEADNQHFSYDPQST